MLPSSLLFQVDPISYIYTFTMWDFLWIASLAAIVSLGLYVIWYISIRRSRAIYKSVETPIPQYTLPCIDDSDFESKIAQIIRLEIGYPSAHPDAHTAHEFRISNKESPLLKELIVLEEREYQWWVLDREEREEILKKMQSRTWK